MAVSTEDTRRAIGVVNAFLQAQADEDKLQQGAAFVTQALTDATSDESGVAGLVWGLINLSQLLLENVRTHTGDAPEQTLQIIAQVLNMRDMGQI